MRDDGVDDAWILYHGIKGSNAILDMERDEKRIRNFKKIKSQFGIKQVERYKIQ